MQRETLLFVFAHTYYREKLWGRLFEAMFYRPHTTTITGANQEGNDVDDNLNAPDDRDNKNADEDEMMKDSEEAIRKAEEKAAREKLVEETAREMAAKRALRAQKKLEEEQKKQADINYKHVFENLYCISSKPRLTFVNVMQSRSLFYACCV